MNLLDGPFAFYCQPCSGDKIGGGLMNYRWDFGDGTIEDSGPTIDHKYMESGSYTLTLTVEDRHGNTDTDTAQIIVLGFMDLMPCIASLLFS